jgi:hypothetical protein
MRRERRQPADTPSLLEKQMYDESQPEPLTGPDTRNATKFHGNDPDANYQGPKRLDGFKTFEAHYERLATFNEGVYSYKWGDNAILRRQDNLAIFDAISSGVDLTTYQKEVGREIMKTAPLRKWSSPNGVDGILVAICVCATVLKNDWRSGRAYHPNRNDENNDDLFVRLLDRFSYRKSTIRSCIQKVDGHVRWKSVDWEQVDSLAAA